MVAVIWQIMSSLFMVLIAVLADRKHKIGESACSLIVNS